MVFDYSGIEILEKIASAFQILANSHYFSILEGPNSYEIFIMIKIQKKD